MTDSTTATFADGLRSIDDRHLAMYAGFGVFANLLVVVGLPKVGGFLSTMVLATYLAAISEQSG